MANPLKGLFQRKPKEAAQPKPAKQKKPGKQKRANLATVQATATLQHIDDLFQPAVKSAVTGPVDLPRFHTMAGDQFGPRLSDRFASFRVKVSKAFTPSQPVVDPAMFAGRRSVLAQMIGAIEDQRLHLVAYGERGIGKTSLLYTLTEAARAARYIVVYWSCGATSNFDETFRAVSAEIPLLFHSRYSPTNVEAEAGATLADLLPTTRISPRVFGEMAAKITGTRVLIVLDEFDRSDSAEFRREIAELIKIMSDRSVRVSLVIAGVAANLAELIEHIPSIRRNVLSFEISLMSSEEIREIVENGERATGVGFDPEVKEAAVAVAHGSPYLATLICHHSSLSALDGERTLVGATDLAHGVQQAITELAERVPRSVQRAAERLIDQHHGRSLAVMSAASLRGHAAFDESMIDNVADSAAEAAQAKRLAEDLARDGELLRKVDVAGQKQYQFLEEGLPAFLWLLEAKLQIGDASRADKRAAAV